MTRFYFYHSFSTTLCYNLMLPQKLCFRIYIVHLPDVMAAFIKMYEKNVKGFVDDKGCPSNCMKSIRHSLF